MLDTKKIEEKILAYWKEKDIFKKTLQKESPKGPFVFFEGPPTANGHPGIHHLIGRAFKDLQNRYRTMKGHHVSRKAGWDTHGLPVEIQVEKELGLKDKNDIEEYGVAKFNEKAKESVWQFKDEWEKFTERIGFWVDMDNPYITYDKNYVETLWWIIKKIDERGLLYEGHKILPWCPRCGTALSSHEVAQEYKEVSDTSVYAKFKLKAGQNILNTTTDDNTYILAWTTTPWTLPGNVALAVGEGIEYGIWRQNGENFIVAKDRKDDIGIDGTSVMEGVLLGKNLVGLEYEPLFDIKALQSETSHKIYPADFVTTEEGTGVVHTAVMYGEDDYNLGKTIGLPMHHTVTPEGKFTEDVPDLEGMFVKNEKAETKILEYLEKNNLLFKKEKHLHDYPFCWRCKTPLLYYARYSWFVEMSKLRDDLIKNNNQVNWVPAHLKNGRFGEFVKEVKDWAFSRERFWGTPLPVWKCQDCKNQKVIGSYQELKENAPDSLNCFYMMRHAESTKNEQKIISSKLENDTYDLTEKGIKIAEESAKKLEDQGGVDLIVSSQFKRAKQTAQIVSKIVGADIVIDERLNELFHGDDYEGKDIDLCRPHDRETPKDLNHAYWGNGETWIDVRKRSLSLLNDLNEKYKGKKILLVGHGDPLAITKAVVKDTSDHDLIDSLISGNTLPEEQRENYPQKGAIESLGQFFGPYDDKGYLNPHRPYVDNVTLKCTECEGEMKRVKEVVDVWFDSGAMPFAQWHYPFENKDIIDNGTQFPADFIGEGIDQTRGWFYTLLAVSTLLEKGPAYKNVISYSHVLDDKGKKMSKSVGNIVKPWDVIDKFGVDTARWYFYTVNNPGEPKLFSMDDVGVRLRGFLMTFSNSLRFFELYKELGGSDSDKEVEPGNKLDEWMLSRLNTTNKEVARMMDQYDVTGASRALESFVIEDLSNWWIRRSRARFQRPESDTDLNKTLEFLRFVLMETSKMLAPFIPFLAEDAYLNLRSEDDPISIHLENWPILKEDLINRELEEDMIKTRDIVAQALSLRREADIKVRQPLASLSIKEKIDEALWEYIKDEVNVKEVSVNENQEEGVALDTKITPELEAEGLARDITRSIQNMRKEAGYKLDQKATAFWSSEDELVKESMAKFEKEIKDVTLLSSLKEGVNENEKYDIEREFDFSSRNMRIVISG